MKKTSKDQVTEENKLYIKTAVEIEKQKQKPKTQKEKQSQDRH